MDADIESIERVVRSSYARLSADEHLLRQLLVLIEKITADGGFEQLSAAVQEVTEAVQEQLTDYLHDKAPYRSGQLH